MASDSTTAMTRPELPPSQYPTSRISAVSRPSRAAVLTPLRCECTETLSLRTDSSFVRTPSSLPWPTIAWGLAEWILCKRRGVGCADGRSSTGAVGGHPDVQRGGGPPPPGQPPPP